jgi:endogenous inhibitor of DNA gyrase (YacG/DUF329 family)
MTDLGLWANESYRIPETEKQEEWEIKSSD